MKKKKIGFFRYSNVDPVDIKYRISYAELLKAMPLAARILGWLGQKELESWHKRKKRPLWHYFSIKDAKKEINASPSYVHDQISFLEKQRYIRRRYRYIRGHSGCRLYMRLMLPNEQLIWEKDPTYKRKYNMHQPTNGYHTQKVNMSYAREIMAGKMFLSEFEGKDLERVTRCLRKLGYEFPEKGTENAQHG